MISVSCLMKSFSVSPMYVSGVFLSLRLTDDWRQFLLSERVFLLTVPCFVVNCVICSFIDVFG